MRVVPYEIIHKLFTEFSKRETVHLSSKVSTYTLGKLSAASFEIEDRPEGPKWTRVEDGVPKDCEDVLVWYEYFAYGERNRMVEAYGIGYYIEHMKGWGGAPGTGVNTRVIAWMPLPEPPKEEKR